MTDINANLAAAIINQMNDDDRAGFFDGSDFERWVEGIRWQCMNGEDWRIVLDYVCEALGE